MADPGTPVVTLPPYTVPVFLAATVAYGETVTDFTLQNTSSVGQTNLPFTFGQPFKPGELTPSDFLVGKVLGEADVPLQFNVKATHPDGSVRHAIISGVLPTLNGSSSKTLSMVRMASGVSKTPFTPNAAISAGFSAVASATIDGITYSASAVEALATAPVWFGGAIATDYIVYLPMKDSGGVIHPTLTVQFSIRLYAINKAKIDISVEHTKAYDSITDITYNAALTIAGELKYSKSSLVHFPCARWKKTYWWNTSAPVHVKHNTPYLIGTKAVSNYDQTIQPNETALNGWASVLVAPESDPMGRGRIKSNMTGTGGNNQLGLAPDSYVGTILWMDKRAKDTMLATADAAGSYRSHRRDTSTGPASGRPIDLIHFPFSGSGGNTSDSINPSTGLAEKFPNQVTTSVLVCDIAHQPALAYIPYLITGDYYYLEELHFWGSFNFNGLNPAYRLYEKGILHREQVRAQAWAMRTTSQSAYITPDDHPAKMAYRYWLDNNLEYYNTTFTDNVSANNLHILATGGAIIYSSTSGVANTGIGNFQDDFFAQAIGLAAELGFNEAKRLLLWKSKWQVSRMLDGCWTNAAIYSPTVRNTSTSPIFNNIQEVLAASLTPELHALPCGSQARLDRLNAERALPSIAYVMNDMTGYAYGTEGYPSVLQCALSYAVDMGYPDADLAWDLFDSRTIKPDYSLSPQFAIVPRITEEIIMPPTSPEDTYTAATGQSIFGGKAPNTSVITGGFDSVVVAIESNDGAPFNTASKILVVILHGSSGQNITNGRQYDGLVSGPMAYAEHNKFRFSTVNSLNPSIFLLRPVDWYGSTNGGARRESMWIGFKNMPTGDVSLITERRLDAMIAWSEANLQYVPNKQCLTGGSMGGWGTLTFGVSRRSKFAALYPDRPRWNGGANISVANYLGGFETVPTVNGPNLSLADGGGSYADKMNIINYVANTNNKIPWIGWCCGRNDGYANFSDQVAAVVAMRSAKRGFAFAWNDGNHSTGSIMNLVQASYPYGTFEIGKGYPLFTEHSLDKDPAIDLVGGINIGLSFRNVVETATGWSCEVTSFTSACTVKVEPISDVFTTAVVPKTVIIPAANTWVVVNFTA